MASDSQQGEAEKSRNEADETGKRDSWIVDDVVAHVENGVVTLQIGRPSPGRHLPRDLPKGSTAPAAQAVAAKDWYTAQMERLARSRASRETATIPLTDRRLRSSLRLGGGFLITQGRYLVLFRRDEAAPNRAALFCECAGAYEVLSTEPKNIENDYVASLLKESAELAIVRKGPDETQRLMIPVLAPGPELPAYAPRPDVGLDEYNKVVERELLSEAWAARLPVIINYWNSKDCDLKKVVDLQQGRGEEPDPKETERLGDLDKKYKWTKEPDKSDNHLDSREAGILADLMRAAGYLIEFQVRILTYDSSVRLQFDYSPEISVEMTAEADSSSLECVGVLGYPEDLERAALAFVGEEAQKRFREHGQKDVAAAVRQALDHIKGRIDKLALWNSPAALLVFDELAKVVVDDLRKTKVDDAITRRTIETITETRESACDAWRKQQCQAPAMKQDEEFRRPGELRESGSFCGQAGKETLCEKRFLGYEYWDTELDGGKAIHRYIYVISTEDGSGWVWKTRETEPKSETEPRPVIREGSPTDLWEALSESRLTRSQGRVATEKLEKAIRMHCPNTALIPLSTL